jgi:hypothetical protein
MMKAAYRPEAGAPVSIFDAQALPWQDTPEPGLRLKPVRYDDERGHFLGLVAFAPLARSGLHQHRGVATSFVVDGSLCDYAGPIGLHQAGINLVGSTHDAVAYQNTLLVSRLEGPVVYPASQGELSGLHAGSAHAEFDNPAPEALPDINVTVDALVSHQTGIALIRRQAIFDYAGTGSAHRFVQMSLAPGAECPTWRCRHLTEFWVRGGLLQIDGRVAHANCFVIVEPGATVRLSSPFGALLLAWAEGPEEWIEPAVEPGSRAVRSSLFGF